MKEHPIIFSGPMVRAILEGRKTQTRRVIKLEGIDDSQWYETREGDQRPLLNYCPYGRPGDTLWVRETFAKRYADAERDPADGIMYRADGGCAIQPRWTPAIHMPRWASRLTLRITDIRVQRVQGITEEDARAEGCSGGHGSIPGYGYSATPREHFCNLWDSINAKRGYSWESSPWVWVITFSPPDAVKERI